MQTTGATGQWLSDGDGHRWWFDSGSVALDFAYTGAMGDNPQWEQLTSAEALSAWLGARFSSVTASSDDRNLTDARMLRAVIAQVAVAVSEDRRPAASDVDVINLFAATPDIPPVLAGGTRQAGRTGARSAQALSTIARRAVELFAEAGHDRIRQCSADDCGLVFYDESRSNNRRWCSMQRCGNRAKVRAHRAKAR